MEDYWVETYGVLDIGLIHPPSNRIPYDEFLGGNPVRFTRVLTTNEIA